MALSAVLLSVAAVVIATCWIFGGNVKKRKNYPPGPPQWPLIGSMGELVRNRNFFEVCTAWSRKYGKVCSIKAGEHEVVIITDYEVARKANLMEELSDRPQLEFFKFFMKYVNAGVLFSNGENWKNSRRFSLKNLRDFGLGKSSIEELVLAEVKELGKTIHPDHLGMKPSVVQLDANLSASVTNIIWWLLANKRVTEQDPDFLNILETIESIQEFDISQLLSFLPAFFRILPNRITGLEKKVKMRDHFYSYMKGVMEEHKKTLDPNEPRDLVDCFIVEGEKLREAGLDASIYEGDMVAWTLCDLFLAGSETTSTALRWYFLFMIHHPQVQRKVQDEIEQIIGRDRFPSYQDRTRMPYTEATIWEVLRLKPSLPVGLPRQARDDIELAGFNISKGEFNQSFDCSHKPGIVITSHITGDIQWRIFDGETMIWIMTTSWRWPSEDAEAPGGTEGTLKFPFSPYLTDATASVARDQNPHSWLQAGGTIVTTIVHTVHRDPEHFVDPDEFFPERFLNPHGSLMKSPKIMPFQAGKRQCLGESLARMTIFLGVTFLLQHFDFAKVKGQKYTFENSERRTEVLGLPRPYSILATPRNCFDFPQGREHQVFE